MLEVKYVRVFIYASIFWVTIGALHLGAIYLGELQAGRDYDATPQIWGLFLSAYFSWAFITTFVYLLVERQPPAKGHRVWVVSCLVTLVVWLVVFALLDQSLSAFFFNYSPGSIWAMLNAVAPFTFLFNTLKFLMIYGVCTCIVYYRNVQDAKFSVMALRQENAEALEKKTRFQLQALQSQLSPHFLFNALNSISGMARNRDNDRIVETVGELGDLLRYAIDSTHQTEVLIGDELQFVDNYIAVQKVRFGNNFTYHIDNQLSDAYHYCPPFCIQTLIENVFSHNELTASNPVDIHLRIHDDKQSLYIIVKNSPVVPTVNTGVGVALSNLRERLMLLYQSDATVDTFTQGNAYIATVKLPKRSDDE